MPSDQSSEFGVRSSEFGVRSVSILLTNLNRECGKNLYVERFRKKLLFIINP
ncbi:hypothetical protein CWATWH8502_3090 [Crocosphaera watsonii WH 8502]|uniref:Uncharacterized protein n=1 Tax=Crocosphaera watsonii WH 8502 TaxID=423474 RepID=T2I9A4_CROWT|nr:hypothetical protein CWATWH8502_3090 [Crocosphaera watsonii WH 8502]